MINFPKKYTMVVDEQVKAMAIKDVSTCGADEFVAKACVRLDCSRIKDDIRMMQTIGTPYKYEEDNPPIVYDKKKGLKKTTRTTRKKAKEATIEGFEKPKKEKAPSAAQLNAQARAKLISKLKIKL